MKNRCRLLLLCLLTGVFIPVYALDDLLIFTGEENVQELGISLSLPYNPGGLNPSNLPSIRANGAKSGINKSDVAVAIQTTASSQAWNTISQFNILNGGLTPGMMLQRKYLKIMVWRNIAMQDMCIQVNSQNWESDNHIYMGTPAVNEWVDVVIDMTQLRGAGSKWNQAVWADSTIRSLRVLPLAKNSSVGTMTVVRIDNIALSDNPIQRTSAPDVGEGSSGDRLIASFEPGALNEIGLTRIRAVAPDASQFEQPLGLALNSQKGGINTTDHCLAMRTTPNAVRWQCHVLADFGGEGITPQMMAKRKYLKMMIWRDYDLNNMRILFNDSDWNASTFVYNQKPLKGEWVDVVIDLSKSAGGTIWAGQTLRSIQFQPIENNSTGLGFSVAVLVDNIVLSSDPFPRTPEGTPVDPELVITYERMFEDLYRSTLPDTAHYLSQKADGSWDDLDYNSTASVYWPCTNHIARLKQMARLYVAQPDSTSDLSRRLRAGIVSGLEYWENVLPTSQNWFYNDIGKQMEFAPLLILARDIVPMPLIRQICRYFVIGTTNPTGANLTAMARSIYARGVLLNNIQTVREAVANMESVIGVVNKSSDGLQVDNSLIFHGKQVFTFNYNSGMLRDAGEYMRYSQGLSFEFKPQYLINLRNMVLEFNRWFAWYRWLDYNSNGRVISMPDRNLTQSFIPGFNLLRELDPTNLPIYDYLINCAANEENDTICGNRMFYRADYMVHRRANYYIGLKMFSNRISGSEMGNGQNLKGYWLGFGATTIYRTAEEFPNIFPLWDWTKVPGTTAANELPSFGWDLKQSASFVGGVSDSIVGVSTMMIDKLNLNARKSWFLFDHEMVALGSGITATHPNDIFTSVAQCYLKGDVWVDGEKRARGDNQTIQEVGAIYHDSIGYLFPKRPVVKLTNTQKTGNWYTISTAEADTIVRGDLFNVWFDHGKQPQDQAYSYVVVPGISNDEFADYQSDLPFEILMQTSKLHAVTQLKERKTGIVFFEAGEVTIHATLKIRAYQGCVVLVDHSGRYLKVTLSDPNQTLTSARLELIYSATSKETLNFTLPDKNHTGACVVGFGQMEYQIPSSVVSNQRASLSFSPNPAKDILHIDGLSTPAELQIVNLQGQLMIRQVVEDRLNISRLSSGVYMIVVDGMTVGKVIKQ